MLEQKMIDIIKSTVPVLKTKGIEITTTFYNTMFERNPEMKPLFDMGRQASGEQPKALAMAILASAQNIDNLEVVLPVVNRIGEKHCDRGILPEHYPVVGENLLIAIKNVLGDACTEDILLAWEQSYGILANIFIDVEKEIYASRNK